jgi:hypothetical protein
MLSVLGVGIVLSAFVAVALIYMAQIQARY